MVPHHDCPGLCPTSGGKNANATLSCECGVRYWMRTMTRLTRLFGTLALAFASAHADTVFDACRYPDDAAAAKAWVAGWESKPAVMREVNGAPALTLECKLSTATSAERAVWDRRITLDLEGAEGIEFDFFCRDAGPVSNFSLYFKSGDGWRIASFLPRRTGRWETITLLKGDMRDEGTPGGWADVSTLRLAAWKGNGGDTVIHLRNFRRKGVLGEDTKIVVARNEMDPRDPFADQLSSLLGKLGLAHTFVRESALTPALLAKTELVMLPHNPGLPDAAAAALQAYVEKGGRLMIFFALPPALRQAAGVESLRFLKSEPAGRFSAIHVSGGALPGAPEYTAQSSWNIHAPALIPGKARVLAEWHDAAGKPTGFPALTATDRVLFMSHVLLDERGENKPQLLLAMAGLLRPACWSEVIAGRRARLDRIADFDSYAEARAALTRQTKPGSEARNRLEQADQLLHSADEQVKQAHFATALDTLGRAEHALRESFCLAQEPKAGEFRAMWCHDAYGVSGMNWDAAIQNLKDNGFNAIFPNMLWGGVAYYPSAVLPVAATVKEKGDAIAECLAACRKHGLEMHVWKVDWNLGHAVPPAFLEQMRKEGRLQRSAQGDEEPWLCPSNPANLKLERESLLEVARNYAVDGIHFDYIRYPDSDHCFCTPCRSRFEKTTGKPVAKWPDDVRGKGARREEWITWCQENISALVRSTSEQVRQVRPGIKISAAVFRNWDVDSRVVMQDWKLWCEKGWLDFLCPMDYTPGNSTFDSWVRRQQELRGPAGLVPGIGASATGISMTADQVIGQIDITRRHGTKGFIIFNYGEREARDTIPLLGLGATRDK